MKRENGFTVIEFLTVIAVIGVLAAVLLPALVNARQQAKDREAAKAVIEATQNEFAAPTTLEALTKKPPTFWAFEYRFGEFVPAGKVVELFVWKGENKFGRFWICLDEPSYSFVEAHKDSTLAEVVSLWRAEQDTKNK